MTVTIRDALVSLRPQAVWSLNSPAYAGLVWREAEDGQTKPTEAEVTAEMTRLDLREQLAAIYEAKEAFGVPVIFDGVVESLQIRPADRANWLGYREVCRSWREAGAGAAVPIDDQGRPIKMRCTSNRSYAVTADVGWGYTNLILGYFGGLLGRNQDLKDLIDTGEASVAHLAFGWPSDVPAAPVAP